MKGGKGQCGKAQWLWAQNSNTLLLSGQCGLCLQHSFPGAKSGMEQLCSSHLTETKPGRGKSEPAGGSGLEEWHMTRFTRLAQDMRWRWESRSEHLGFSKLDATVTPRGREGLCGVSKYCSSCIWTAFISLTSENGNMNSLLVGRGGACGVWRGAFHEKFCEWKIKPFCCIPLAG